MSNQSMSIDSSLYKSIVEEYLESQSVKKTSVKLSVSEVKVRKVLITENLWSSRTSVMVQHFLAEGKTTEEISGILGTSVKAVQQYLPYTRGLYNGEQLSASAICSAEYRERIKTAQERVLKRNREYLAAEGWSEPEGEMKMDQNSFRIKENKHFQESENMDKDVEELIRRIIEGEEEFHFPQYDGIVCMRELPPEMEPERSRLWMEGADIVRLHFELRRDGYDFLDYEDDGHDDSLDNYQGIEEETRVLKTYGEVKYGNTISRDILVPSSLPLYAVHYMIQAAFGWENSHLHRFELPPKQFEQITDNNAEKWKNLVGVLFRSPWMEEEDMFWADDYEDGSFKNWLRKKYTGPYLSLCHGEGIVQCTEDMKEIEKTKPWGRKTGKAGGKRLKDFSVRDIREFFMEGGVNHLLERIPIGELLALHGKGPGDGLEDGEEICNSFEEFMDEDMKAEIRDILQSGGDFPDMQPLVYPVTDVLYYFYDFGDNWRIKITGSLDACDLVEQGRVTQAEIDAAIRKIHETYRPVCIAADGLPLVDDAGGIDGYCRFLRSIHPTEEKEYWGKNNVPDNWAYEDKKGSLQWAKRLGWKEKVSVKRLL